MIHHRHPPTAVIDDDDRIAIAPLNVNHGGHDITVCNAVIRNKGVGGITIAVEHARNDGGAHAITDIDAIESQADRRAIVRSIVAAAAETFACANRRAAVDIALQRTLIDGKTHGLDFLAALDDEELGDAIHPRPSGPHRDDARVTYGANLLHRSLHKRFARSQTYVVLTPSADYLGNSFFGPHTRVDPVNGGTSGEIKHRLLARLIQESSLHEARLPDTAALINEELRRRRNNRANTRTSQGKDTP